MPPLTPLIQIADTAALLGEDGTHLCLALPDGHRLRVVCDKPGRVVVISENLRMVNDPETGLRLDKVHHCLATLPAPGRRWATGPEARWTEVQAFLHDHAQRPILLNTLLVALCLEHNFTRNVRVNISFRHTRGRAPEASVYTTHTEALPHAARVAALKIHTVRHRGSPGALTPNDDTNLVVTLPSTMHARLGLMSPLTHGTGREQIERLEAAWLGQAA